MPTPERLVDRSGKGRGRHARARPLDRHPGRTGCGHRFWIYGIALGLCVAEPILGAELAPPAFSFWGLEIMGDDRDRVLLGAGIFNVIPVERRDKTRHHSKVLAAARTEYRLGHKLYGFGPLLGLMVNHEGGVLGYASIYTVIRLGERWHLSPAGGIAAYGANGGKDLGGVFEFHLAADLAYEFDGGQRLGVMLSHTSNANTHEDNPGVETLMLTYQVPLPW